MAEKKPLHKRMRRFEGDGCARFVTFSTHRRFPLFANDAIKDLFAKHLAASRLRGGFRLFAWVVMPEHVHLVIWPRERTGSSVLNGLKSGFGRVVIARWRAIGAPVLGRVTDEAGVARFWQRGGGYDRNIRDEDELREKIGYVHANPVKRGLVDHPTDWVWSSARRYEGDRDGVVQIDRWV